MKSLNVLKEGIEKVEKVMFKKNYEEYGKSLFEYAKQQEIVWIKA